MSTHIFESITERFGYGNYLDLKIIIDSKTNYINATKLCQLGGKKLYKWHATDGCKELLDCWAEACPSVTVGANYEIHSKDIDTTLKTHIDVIKGTYYHKDLIVHIAQWISPAFAFKVSKIINDYIDKENNRTIRELRGENKSLLDEVKDLKQQNNELLAATRTIITMNHDQNAKLDKMSSDIARIRSLLDNNTSTPDKREAILIYRNENDPISTIRIRAGINAYLKRFKTKASWYKEYTNISNSKKALNIMKDNGLIEFEKGKTTKTILHDKNDRIYLRECLKKLDESYANDADA